MDEPRYVVDDTPPPKPRERPTLRDMIRGLEEGRSLLIRGRTLGTVKTSVSQVKYDSKRPMPDRRFTVEPAPDEPGAVRVWRLVPKEKT